MSTIQSETAAATSSPAELVRHIFDVEIAKRDAEALRPYWTDDVVETMPSGVYRGPEEMVQYFAEIFHAVPDFEMHAEHVAADGDTVLVKWRVTGNFTAAPWQGIEPTGDRLDIHGFDCLTVRDGKIAGNFVLFNEMEFARQIGMLPAQGSAAETGMTRAFNAKTKLRRRFRGGKS